MSIINNLHYDTLISIDDNSVMEIKCTSKKTTAVTFTYLFKFNKKRLQNLIGLSDYGFQVLIEMFKNKSLIERLNLTAEQTEEINKFINNFKTQDNGSEHIQHDTPQQITAFEI